MGVKSHTTGEVAALCGVTKRTVIKWIDSGKLKGYLIPGSTHRRVAATVLAEFMRLNQIPHSKDLMPRRRVLIVDDDRDLVELLKDALRHDYDLECAGSALEAASRLPLFQPDVVLLDIRLPDLNGLEVCRHFQSYCRTKKVPILVMSAFGREIDLSEVRRSGADEFLSKPLKIADLRKRIHHLVG